MTSLDGNPFILRAVTEPDVGAEVLFDFNAELQWPDHDTFTLGAPPLKGEPGAVATEYDFRAPPPSWTQVTEAGDVEAMRLQAELARLLMRPEWYLHVQFDADAPPAWLRVVRSSTGAQSLASVYKGRYKNLWQVAVTLVADPFMLGERRTETVTFRGDPAAPDGPARVLPDPGGVAPAPLTLDASTPVAGRLAPRVSVLPLDVPTGDPVPTGAVAWQAETWALSAGTTLVTGASASNGQATNTQLGNSTGNQQIARRLTGFVSVPWAGRWQLYARAQFVATASPPGDPVTVVVRGAGPALVSTPGSVLQRSAANAWQLLDLGVFSIPKGNQPSRRPYTVEPVQVGIDAGVDTTSTLLASLQVRFDYILAVPLDVPLDQVQPPATLDFGPVDLAGARLVVDGDARWEERRLAASEALSGVPSRPTGEYPVAVPGAVNLMHVLPRWQHPTVPGQQSDTLTHQVNVTVSWHPRHLYLPDHS